MNILDGHVRRARSKLIRAGALLFGCALLAACAASGTRTPAGSASPAAVVRSYIEAFNKHDSAAVAALLSPDLQWLAIEGDQVKLEAAGRDALTTWLSGYFAEFADVQASVELFERGARYVAVYECVSWTGISQTTGQGKRRQCAHGHFEVQDGLIRRVWYWPAEA